MVQAALYSSATDQWNTPADLMDTIARFYDGAFLDPCPADPPADFDGLALSWFGQRVYMNPPYGRSIGKWVEKALGEYTREIVMLVPARTDTAWFQPLFDHTICFLRGRLHFNDAPTGAPFPSALVYRGCRPFTFAHTFEHLGSIVMTAPLGKHWRDLHAHLEQA